MDSNNETEYMGGFRRIKGGAVPSAPSTDIEEKFKLIEDIQNEINKNGWD